MSSTGSTNPHPAFDMTSISSQDDLHDDGEPQTLRDVPKQKSYHHRHGAVLNDDDRELRCFHVAFISKFLFLAATCMALWMATDDLSWSYEAQRIPEDVLAADDAVTWNTYRTSTGGGSRNAHIITYGNGVYMRNGNSNQDQEGTDDQDEQIFSQFHTSNNHRRLFGSSTGRRQQDTSTSTASTSANSGWSVYTPWDQLPFSIQIAAATLGYTQQTWDNGGATFSDNLYWDDLSTEEQLAAETLGYSQITWDKFRLPPDISGTPSSGSTSATTGTTSSGSTSSSTTTTSTGSIWRQSLWSDLPADIQQQAQYLGYDQQSWDNNQRTTIQDSLWNQLGEEQQQAALKLGYTEDSWNAQAASGTGTGTGTSSSGSASTTSTDPVDWTAYSWSDLPTTIQLQATLLGFTESSWDAGSRLAVDQYQWSDLSSEQQQAAFVVFGYTENKWNAEYVASNSNKNWQGTAWDDLPASIQEQAQVLGYDADLWNQGAPLAMDQYTWDELSQEQQTALGLVFGLDAESWGGTQPQTSSISSNNNIHRKNNGQGHAGGRGAADDDFAFVVGASRENPVWVSQYQIVAFVSALLLIVVGNLDRIREQRWYHLAMIFAGLAALLSAMFVESNKTLSGIFHVLSTHALLAQAVAQFFHRKSLHDLLLKAFSNALWLGDGCFAFGALLQSILSYVYFQERAQQNQDLARASVVAALCLVLTAIVYLMTTFALCRREKD